MTTGQLKEHLEASPFRPFKTITAGGHGIRVPHGDYVSVGPRDGTVIVWTNNEGFSVVDVMLVTHLEFAQPKASKARRDGTGRAAGS